MFEWRGSFLVYWFLYSYDIEGHNDHVMDIQDINIVKKLHVEEFAQEFAFVPWLHLPSNV